MIRYVDDTESLGGVQRLAAIVAPPRGADPVAVRDGIAEAIRRARLIAWDLSEVPAVEPVLLDEVNLLANQNESLVVIVAAQPAVIRMLSERPMSNLVLGQ
jgi:hypothetical protein